MQLTSDQRWCKQSVCLSASVQAKRPGADKSELPLRAGWSTDSARCYRARGAEVGALARSFVADGEKRDNDNRAEGLISQPLLQPCLFWLHSGGTGGTRSVATSPQLVTLRCNECTSKQRGKRDYEKMVNTNHMDSSLLFVLCTATIMKYSNFKYEPGRITNTLIKSLHIISSVCVCVCALHIDATSCILHQVSQGIVPRDARHRKWPKPREFL